MWARNDQCPGRKLQDKPHKKQCPIKYMSVSIALNSHHSRSRKVAVPDPGDNTLSKIEPVLQSRKKVDHIQLGICQLATSCASRTSDCYFHVCSAYVQCGLIPVQAARQFIHVDEHRITLRASTALDGSRRQGESAGLRFACLEIVGGCIVRPPPSKYQVFQFFLRNVYCL